MMQRIENSASKLPRKNLQIPICANVDIFGLVYEMLGIPEDLFTPLFAIARIAGWCAHRIEEVISGKNLFAPRTGRLYATALTSDVGARMRIMLADQIIVPG